MAIATPRLFEVGAVVRTYGALNEMLQAGVPEWSLLERHQSGDFGEVREVQKRANARAIAGHGRVFSAYRIDRGCVVWVVTERLGQQTRTTLMLPGDRARRVSPLPTEA